MHTKTHESITTSVEPSISDHKPNWDSDDKQMVLRSYPLTFKVLR